MQTSKHTITICGAGIAGVATAYYLLKADPKLHVAIIDKNQPLSFTTSKSGEHFRDFWPQKSMRDFVSHSMDLMQDLKNQYGQESFMMKYSGYNFISLDKDKPIFSLKSQEIAGTGLEQISDRDTIKSNYPYLSEKVEQIIKIKNAGDKDVYAMGSLLLREARKLGLQLTQGEIISIEKDKDEFKINLDSNESIRSEKVVIAAGPFINSIANMLGFEVPTENVLQQKFIIPDPLKIIPKDMPFTICVDPQYLDWSEEEKEFFTSDENYKWLLDEFPGALHIKPEPNGMRMGWAFNQKSEAPSWTPKPTELFPQIVLKGASRFIPQLKEYENNIPSPIIRFAGYYTRTNENWPLIGPVEIPNVFLVGAFAGYGTMSACAAGELCSKYILKKTELPDYAPYFHPLRYNDPRMVKEMEALQSDGQL